jgi:hypothetical protein
MRPRAAVSRCVRSDCISFFGIVCPPVYISLLSSLPYLLSRTRIAGFAAGVKAKSALFTGHLAKESLAKNENVL